jgi:hypothetical protein
MRTGGFLWDGGFGEKAFNSTITIIMQNKERERELINLFSAVLVVVF